MGGNLARDCICVNHVVLATELLLAGAHLTAYSSVRKIRQRTSGIWHRPSVFSGLRSSNFLLYPALNNYRPGGAQGIIRE